MKKTVGIFLCLVGLQAGAAEVKSAFEFVRTINGSLSKGQRGRVVVPGDVFGQARDFPADVRVIGDDGSPWPFFLYRPESPDDNSMLTPEILNQSFVSGPEPYLQFDLVVPAMGGKIPVHNRLELSTSGLDFIRRVEVSSLTGGVMGSGYLVDFLGNNSARNRIIRYPTSDTGRLHVRIYSNAQHAGESFGLSFARLYYRSESKVERETVEFDERTVSAREQTEGAQTHILDVGHPNRPVEFVTLDIRNPSYVRSLDVCGRNTEHEPWRWVWAGEIHAVERDEQKELVFHATYRYLKLTISHYEDPPLDIRAITLQAIPRYLVFEAAAAGSATLCFRAWDMNPPRFDLEGRIKKEAIATLPLFRLQEAQQNEHAQFNRWRKYSKWIGILAVGAVSLLVLGVIVSMLREPSIE